MYRFTSPSSFLLIRAINSGNNITDNQRRTLKDDEEANWFWTPGLKEKHSSRVFYVMPTQQKKDP